MLVEDMVFPRCVPLPSSNFVPFRWSHARGRGTVAESLEALCWVGTPEIRRRRRAARSTMNQESGEPLWAKIKSANREVYEEKADL